jgi:hypothetical protein
MMLCVLASYQYMRSDRSAISPNIPGVFSFELHDDDDIEVGKIFYRYTRRSSWLCETLRGGIPTKKPPCCKMFGA